MPNILLIEDNPGDARLISEILHEAGNFQIDYKLTHVQRAADAVAVLASPNDIDIILSDITLPDSSGRQTFTILTQNAVNVPIVFMTGSNDESFAIEAIQQGAQDYLVKGRISSEALAKAITYAIERKKVQVAMSQAVDKARQSQAQLKLMAQQKRQLLKLNQAKDEFISLASHQLRTPATAVKQYIGMIIEGYVGDIDERQRPLLQTAYDSNERQLEIINELLKTAQLDSSYYDLNIHPEDVGILIREVIDEQQPTLRLRRQLVKFDTYEPCVVRVDASEFKLVCSNLLENASKYTQLGKTITINIRQRNKKAIISFADQGVGIASEDQKRIFDKFTRVDNELSDTVTGNGLGLYWVRKIIRLHKGTIEVDSQPGQGSTFTLTLPL